MAEFKPYKCCDISDSFFIQIPLAAASTGLFSASGIIFPVFKLPILFDKNTRYFKITCVNVNSTTGTNVPGTYTIKCNSIASSDKTLCVFDIPTGTSNVNMNYRHVHKVITPVSGELQLQIQAVIGAIMTPAFDGTINIGIDCYM